MNEQLAFNVIQEAVRCGVTEFCICPGNRNGPLYKILSSANTLKKYYWPEERSAAFFALGRAKATGYPVAVVTTSGTAAAELLPAAIEAHYLGIPLLLITADRPRRFRGSGAPQTIDQVNIYGGYPSFFQDIENEEQCRIAEWDCKRPAHLNVCFEDPFPKGKAAAPLRDVGLLAVNSMSQMASCESISDQYCESLTHFLKKTQRPLVVVSTIKVESKESVAQFLLNLNAPVYLESLSGLREDARLQPLRIRRTDNLWQASEYAGYPIDGILRIGGIPTFRTWRDLEDRQGDINVCSINDVPFPGLSWGDIIHANVAKFFSYYEVPKSYDLDISAKWREADKLYSQHLDLLFEEEPRAEASLIHTLSERIPTRSRIYLGNSLPVREWDLGATSSERYYTMSSSRGAIGIDGQTSTFFGWSVPKCLNWGIIGDLTALYDLVAPWILKQITEIDINLVVVNNGGGQIFAKFIPEKNFINTHDLEFLPIAQMWRMHYERWETIPDDVCRLGHNLFEIIPDPKATERFNKKLGML